MPKADYIPSNDDAFGALLTNFAATIGSYAVTLGLTPAQLTAQANDASNFAEALSAQEMMRDASQQWTTWKDMVRGGSGPAAPAPVVPGIDVPLAPITPGVEGRFRALVKQIKASAGYTHSIGAALGIEGAEQVAPDMSTIQPVITAKTMGTTVVVGWNWGGQRDFLDLCEIQVDRGDAKGFVPLSFDTTPNYTDTQPFPATPVKWIYQAIYRVGDHRVGQWSSPVSITVGGWGASAQ
jgi:hypothetical protein